MGVGEPWGGEPRTVASSLLLPVGLHSLVHWEGLVVWWSRAHANKADVASPVPAACAPHASGMWASGWQSALLVGNGMGLPATLMMAHCCWLVACHRLLPVAMQWMTAAAAAAAARPAKPRPGRRTPSRPLAAHLTGDVPEGGGQNHFFVAPSPRASRRHASAAATHSASRALK